MICNKISSTLVQLFRSLTDSAWAVGNMATLAEQACNTAELPICCRPPVPQYRSNRQWMQVVNWLPQSNPVCQNILMQPEVIGAVSDFRVKPVMEPQQIISSISAAVQALGELPDMMSASEGEGGHGKADVVREAA